MAHSGASHSFGVENILLFSYVKSIQRSTWKTLHLETTSQRRLEINLFAEISLPSLSLCQNLPLGTLVSHIPVLFNLADYLGSHQRNPSFLGHNPAIVQAQGSLLVSWHRVSFSLYCWHQWWLQGLYSSGNSVDLFAKTTLAKKQGKWPRPGEHILE